MERVKRAVAQVREFAGLSILVAGLIAAVYTGIGTWRAVWGWTGQQVIPTISLGRIIAAVAATTIIGFVIAFGGMVLGGTVMGEVQTDF